MALKAKICGVNSRVAAEAAVAGGAAFVGLVFYPPSPRNVTPAEAEAVAAAVPPSVTRVGLFVDAEDAVVEAAVTAAGLGMLQLHGGETPARVAALRKHFGLPVMKAIPIASAADVAAAEAYLGVADWLLFDAKPPPAMANALPGGNALRFDWTLIAGRRWPLPWMLSGGLDAANLAEAVRISGAAVVDVSSGVEDRPGHKDPARIAAFLAAAKAL
ncbi:MAG TPA: phosphoribosylanthranilate isomerase [Alphaproteobacteria bacterium]|nr:phosphoribosylanthranilate isomerase [Alphaproteobacteria bacterium]